LEKLKELPQLSNHLNLKGDDFKVCEIIEGGMGYCLKLNHLDSNNFYAAKLIYSEYLTNENSINRYINELRKWFALSSSDGIAEALTLIRLNEIPCMVSNWMENGNLRKKINEKGPFYFYQTIERIIKILD